MKIIHKQRLQRKMQSKSKSLFSLIQDEMELLKTLDHPGIIKVFELIDDESHHKQFIIMEYAQNQSLAHYMNRKNFSDGPLRSVESLSVFFKQLVSALKYCHIEKKILHRDIKPENILLDRDFNGKLADFGVSKILKTPEDDICVDMQGS